MTVPATVTAVSVRDEHGRQLATLSGDGLTDRVQELGSVTPATSIPAFGVAVIVMDVPVAPTRAVRALRTSVGYAVTPGNEVPALVTEIGLNWTAVSPLTPVSTFAPPVLAAPIAGQDWVNSNSAGDPTASHSGARMTKGALMHTNEAYAIDFIKLVDGDSHSGDGTSNDQYYAYGSPILSASTGTVISVRTTMRDVEPGGFPTDLTSVDQAGGNDVVVRMGPGVYLLYGHLIPGSVTVKAGDTLRVGQRLGLLGNSGNSTGPHLHFQLMDGPDVMNADSLPFVFDSFTRTGVITVDATGAPTVTGPARHFTRVYPDVLSVNTFGR